MLLFLAVMAIHKSPECADDGQVDRVLCTGVAECRKRTLEHRDIVTASTAYDDELPGTAAGLAAVKPPPIEALTELLASPDEYPRNVAARALGLIGPPAAPAVRVLSAHLDDTREASKALGFIGDPAAVAPLLRALDQRDPFATKSLARLGRPAAVAVAQFYVDKSLPYTNQRSAALDVLEAMRPEDAAAAVPIVLGALDGADPEWLEEMLAPLRILGVAAHDAIPDLRRLRNETTDMKLRADIDNVRLRIGDGSAANDVVQHVAAKDLVGFFAVETLGEVGPSAKAAVPQLIDLLAQGPWDLRERVAHALETIGDARTIPALTRALNAPDWRLNSESAMALGRLGGAATPSLPALRRLATSHWSARVRADAAKAVARIRGDEPIPPLRPGLDGLRALGREHSLLPHAASCRRTEQNGIFLTTKGPDEGKWRGDWVSVDRDAVWAKFAAIPEDIVLPPPNESGGLDLRTGIVVDAPGGRLVGRNRGEWGGEAYFVPTNGEAVLLVASNVVGFATIAGQMCVVTGLAHITLNDGALYRIDRDNKGVRAVPIVELPGAPTGFTIRDDHLIITTADDVAAVSVDGDIDLLQCR